MAFDLATAKPVSSGFDLSTAKPVEAPIEQPVKQEVSREQQWQETPEQESSWTDIFTGADRETRATEELPELGRGGLLAGEDVGTVAKIAPVLAMTYDPLEVSKIIQTNFPEIRQTEDEKGNIILNNNKTGAQVVVNKPGFSYLDLIQGAGTAAAFTPAAKLAATAPTALKAAGAGGILAGGTEAAVQAGQELTGGEFDVEDVAIATALGGAGEGVAKVFQNRSATKDKIFDMIKEGDLDAETATSKIGKNLINQEVLKTDSLASETIKQGFDKGVIAAVKGASPKDKLKMADMVTRMEKGKTNKLYSMKNRPSDVAGDSFLERINYVSNVNKEAGKELNQVAKNLKGQEVDFSSGVDTFMDDLADMGVNLSDDFKPKFKGSDIEGLKGPQNILKNVVNRMRNTKTPDAYDVHRLKKYIDENVSYGKQKGGLTGKAERIIKNLRRNLDASLDDQFADYNRVNTVFSDTIQVLDDVNKSTGSKVKYDSANKALGTELRKLMSNYSSRVNLLDAIENIEGVAKKYDAKFDDDIMTQVLFADELDTVFGPVARTSLKGEVERSVKRGVEAAATGNFIDAAIDIGAKGIEKVRGINEEGAFKSIKDLLKN